MVHSLMIDDHGFPHGYFVIRSVATNRLLDIQGDCVEDGTEIVLWPEKEGSLVEGPLVPTCQAICTYPCTRIQGSKCKQSGLFHRHGWFSLL